MIGQALGQKRSLLMVLAVVAIVAAIWSTLLITESAHKTLDQRVREVGLQLKCPICQGESVADSPSYLAQQMRGIIREQLQSGKSEQEVIQYFVRSYGDQIVWSPPWQGFALLVWLVPVVLLLGGVVLLLLIWRDWRALAPAMTAGLAMGEEDKEVEELAGLDEAEIERYRAMLERELAADDPLFARGGKEEQ